MTDQEPITNRRDTTVVLFGEILADVFPDRHVLGGAPFNVARHLQAFGFHPVLVSRTGDDELCRELISRMNKLGMDTQGLQKDPVHPTGRVRVHMEQGAHRFEILPDQAYDFIDAQSTWETTHVIIPELIYFGTLAQRHPVSRKALKTLFKTTKAKRFLDINMRKPWYEPEILKYSLSQADRVKLNADELQHLGSLLNIEEEKPEDLAYTLISYYDLEHLLVTRGDAGAWLMNADGKIVATSAHSPARVVDTVGAGDAFSSVFILGLFSRWPMKETLVRAAGFARSICEIRGAVPDDDSFYHPFRSDWNLTNGACP